MQNTITIILGISAIITTCLANKYYLDARKYRMDAEKFKRQKEMAIQQFSNLDRTFVEVCHKHGEDPHAYLTSIFGKNVQIKTTEIKEKNYEQNNY